jgi:hypothetical protein
MAAVRNLANQNRTVVCTIHQPSIEVGWYMLLVSPFTSHDTIGIHKSHNIMSAHQVFALFDKLILLAPVGEQVWSRPFCLSVWLAG